MPSEPIYPATESLLELLDPGGGEVVHHETTVRVDEVVEVLRAASTFGYGVEVRSYWRHDHLDVLAGTAVMEWDVLVWKDAAELGRDLDGKIRAIREEMQAEEDERFAARAEAARTVQVVCPGAGKPPSGPGEYNGSGICPGCGRSMNMRQTGTLNRHSTRVLASSPEATKLQRWGTAGKPRPRRAGRAETQPTAAEPAQRPTVPPVTVRCPGRGKSVQLDKPSPPRCPSCKRDDLEVPRFSPSRAFGLVPAHGKTVPADSEEAALPKWEGA